MDRIQNGGLVVPKIMDNNLWHVPEMGQIKFVWCHRCQLSFERIQISPSTIENLNVMVTIVSNYRLVNHLKKQKTLVFTFSLLLHFLVGTIYAPNFSPTKTNLRMFSSKLLKMTPLFFFQTIGLMILSKQYVKVLGWILVL